MPSAADTRYRTGPLVTVDHAGTVLPEGEVAHDAHGVLTYVGPPRGPLGPDDVDLSGHIVTPGLVNGHTHSAMTLLRGVSDDAELGTWLEDVQAVEQHMTPGDVRAGLRLAMAEMLLTGTTTFSDMYYWDSGLLSEVHRTGMRVSAALALFHEDVVGFPRVSADDGAAVLRRTEELAAEFAGDRFVRVRFGPHAPYTCQPEMLAEVARRAERLGLGVQIHLSENAAEVRQSLEIHGRTPVQVADASGLLRVPTLVAHAVHVTADDIQILAARGATVSHNPLSNLKLGSGIAPLRELRAAGVPIALGTDGAASNNSLDLFEELRLAAVLHRASGPHPGTPLPTSTDAVTMATREGAAAVGFPEAGALEAGRWADFVAVRTDTMHAMPPAPPVSHLTYAARGADVRHVVVGGRRLVVDGALVTLDEAEVRAEARACAARLRAAAVA